MKRGILCFMEELNIKKILSVINYFLQHSPFFSL